MTKIPPSKRPDWDSYFINMLGVVKTRSPDPKTKVAAIIVDCNNRVISMGYNGLIPGFDENLIDWGNRPLVYDRIIHAEANAILYAKEIPDKSRIYCSFSPCKNCIKLISSSGVKTVIYESEYKDIVEVKTLAMEFGIKLRNYSEETYDPNKLWPYRG